MTTKLLHIGLPKCGSTLLNVEIFSRISRELNIKKFGLYDLIKPSDINIHPLENINNIQEKLPKNFIISDESLFSWSWEFNNIDFSFECIKNNFSKDTIILLFIRNPYDLLNSIYAQSIMVLDIVSPDNFFYFENNLVSRKNNRFNLYNFDFDYLISLYKSYFNKVIVIKYENFKDYTYLKEIFNINDNFINYIKKKNFKYYNRSISDFGVRSHLFLNKFIDLKRNQRKIKEKMKKTNNYFNKLNNKFLNQLLLRNFFQNKFDNIFPYKKYYIKKEYIPINIEKLINKYNDIV